MLISLYAERDSVEAKMKRLEAQYASFQIVSIVSRYGDDRVSRPFYARSSISMFYSTNTILPVKSFQLRNMRFFDKYSLIIATDSRPRTQPFL